MKNGNAMDRRSRSELATEIKHLAVALAASAPLGWPVYLLDRYWRHRYPGFSWWPVLLPIAGVPCYLIVLWVVRAVWRFFDRRSQE